MSPLRHGHRKCDRQHRTIEDWSAVERNFRPVSKKNILAQSAAISSLTSDSSGEHSISLDTSLVIILDTVDEPVVQSTLHSD